ncbi:MAG: hypothetical protein ACRCX9_03535, partial [Plesiomonas shigelloides]
VIPVKVLLRFLLRGASGCTRNSGRRRGPDRKKAVLTHGLAQSLFCLSYFLFAITVLFTTNVKT